VRVRARGSSPDRRQVIQAAGRAWPTDCAVNDQRELVAHIGVHVFDQLLQGPAVREANGRVVLEHLKDDGDFFAMVMSGLTAVPGPGSWRA